MTFEKSLVEEKQVSLSENLYLVLPPARSRLLLRNQFFIEIEIQQILWSQIRYTDLMKSSVYNHVSGQTRWTHTFKKLRLKNGLKNKVGRRHQNKNETLYYLNEVNIGKLSILLKLFLSMGVRKKDIKKLGNGKKNLENKIFTKIYPKDCSIGVTQERYEKLNLKILFSVKSHYHKKTILKIVSMG